MPDTKVTKKPGGQYRVIHPRFTYDFAKYGRRTVVRGDVLELTAPEATALTEGPVMVEGPKPGSEVKES